MEINCGFIDMDRDVILHLLSVVNNPMKTREIIGICEKTFEWRSHSYFLKIRRESRGEVNLSISEKLRSCEITKDAIKEHKEDYIFVENLDVLIRRLFGFLPYPSSCLRNPQQQYLLHVVLDLLVVGTPCASSLFDNNKGLELEMLTWLYVLMHKYSDMIAKDKLAIIIGNLHSQKALPKKMEAILPFLLHLILPEKDGGRDSVSDDDSSPSSENKDKDMNEWKISALNYLSCGDGNNSLLLINHHTVDVLLPFLFSHCRASSCLSSLCRISSLAHKNTVIDTPSLLSTVTTYLTHLLSMDERVLDRLQSHRDQSDDDWETDVFHRVADVFRALAFCCDAGPASVDQFRGGGDEYTYVFVSDLEPHTVASFPSSPTSSPSSSTASTTSSPSPSPSSVILHSVPTSVVYINTHAHRLCVSALLPDLGLRVLALMLRLYRYWTPYHSLARSLRLMLAGMVLGPGDQDRDDELNPVECEGEDEAEEEAEIGIKEGEGETGKRKGGREKMVSDDPAVVLQKATNTVLDAVLSFLRDVTDEDRDLAYLCDVADVCGVAALEHLSDVHSLALILSKLPNYGAVSLLRRMCVCAYDDGSSHGNRRVQTGLARADTVHVLAEKEAELCTLLEKKEREEVEEKYRHSHEEKMKTARKARDKMGICLYYLREGVGGD